MTVQIAPYHLKVPEQRSYFKRSPNVMDRSNNAISKASRVERVTMRRIKLAALLIMLPTSLSFMAVAQLHLSADPAQPAPLAQLALLHPASNTLASMQPDMEPREANSVSPGANGLVRTVPVPPAKKKLPSMRPFRTAAFGIKANTLGAGVELATPLSGSLNLRSGYNVYALGSPFGVDGVNYNAQFHFRSSQTTLDWFPMHGGFHISPGILHAQNAISAIATVPAGQNFSLGDQTFLNSVADPVKGTMSVVYPRSFSPLLLLGFGNILPRTSRHLSIPFEAGVAYTGSPAINVNLTGTACTSDGCVGFANNAVAQASLQQEIRKINEDLKKLPVYPILSLGLAYHF